MQLPYESLLNAEGIGRLEVYLVANHVAPRFPHIARLLIATVELAYVVRADEEFLRMDAQCHEQQQC